MWHKLSCGWYPMCDIIYELRVLGTYMHTRCKTSTISRKVYFLRFQKVELPWLHLGLCSFNPTVKFWFYVSKCPFYFPDPTRMYQGTSRIFQEISKTPHLGSHGRYVKQDVMWNTLVTTFRITRNFGFFKMKNARNFGFISKDFNGELYRGCIAV